MQNTRYDIDIIDLYIFCGRTSCEVRGLKFVFNAFTIERVKSHLMRGAWIEISNGWEKGLQLDVAPHARCVD